MKRRQVVHLFIIVIILLSGLMVGEQKSAYACSCAMAPGSYEKELADSDYVFDGVVTNKKEKKSLLGTISSDDPVEWTFQVNGSWKGEVTEVATVYSALSSVSCGYEFKVGKRYAVFANGTNDLIKVSLCSKTMQIADNSDIFTELGLYKDENSVRPIDEVTDDKVNNPVSSIEDNSTKIKELSENRGTVIMVTDQYGSSSSKITIQEDSIEKVSPNGIVAVVIIFILLFLFSAMLIYKRRRKT
ncbi:MAG: hypothetical protein NAG76_17180 [Candidatus Pristimantibacillus lignocellulolyticus]|uniref:Tissue inhibitor of metalloproteinase n=1 Tax=Candidatus Pristimantibacillus lignocellulolyticus TaxID=2994561 RepID=A0A9J6ZBY1_9BACL|nr:MAG: hypothetical protein NAG76_17180 [Candidatus Pristimantibacillus lignocellulolyticus]